MAIKDLRKALLETAMLENPTTESQCHVVELFADFLEKILMLNPEQRMTIEDALKHPFVTYA